MSALPGWPGSPAPAPGTWQLLSVQTAVESHTVPVSGEGDLLEKVRGVQEPAFPNLPHVSACRRTSTSKPSRFPSMTLTSFEIWSWTRTLGRSSRDEDLRTAARPWPLERLWSPWGPKKQAT